MEGKVEATIQGLGFGGFPIIKGTLLGVAIQRMIIFWGVRV